MSLTSPKLLLDTNIVIDLTRGNFGALEFIKNNHAKFCMSVVSYVELLTGIRPNEAELLAQFLMQVELLEVNLSVAELAGKYRQKYLRSHQLTLADAIIAATAEIHNCQLITLNVKDFPMFKLKRPY